MEDLSFLILDKLKDLPYYNTASVINLYPNDPDFEGYRETRLLQEFSHLIDQNILAVHPITGGGGMDKNYRLTDKGEKAYVKEKQIREQSLKDSELQKRLSDSVIKVNESVIQTNQSVQSTNEFVTENARQQNKLTTASILVAVSAVVVAAVPFVYNLSSKDGTQQLLNEIQMAHKTIKEQNQELTKLIKQQDEIDSLFIRALFEKQKTK